MSTSRHARRGDDSVHVAVAGAGAFGREHLQALAAIDGVTIAGIADVDPVAAQGAAERFGVETVETDVRAMIERAQPDGVVIATPGATHVALARMALALGLPVLLEKPVGLSAADADALIVAEAGAPDGAFVLPGHILRFSAPYRQVAAIVRSGEIGAVLSVTARNHRDESHAVRYPDIDPVLMTMVHDIDMALWITGGDIETAFAVRRPRATARSETLVTATDSTGAMWHFSNAWTYPTLDAPTDRLEVVGERGSVELTLGESIRVFGDSTRAFYLGDAAADDMLANEIMAFRDAIETGRKPEVVSLADARKGLVAADAILESLRTGEIIRR